jgi:integrase/recombinase XerD
VPLVAEYICRLRSFIQETETVMAQASVLNESEIRRVFRIIETTRHVERNRLCFVLSLFSGMRVGEISALTVADVATWNGEIRREIKLGVHQTKRSKGRTVILSERVRKEIASFLKNKPPCRDQDSPLIASQRNGRAFSNVTLSMLFGKSTRLQVFGLPRIRAEGLLPRA